jgi:hypothetical protein
MTAKEKELWEKLCAQAAVEKDRDKLMALIAEIDRLLTERRPPQKTENSNSSSESNGRS